LSNSNFVVKNGLTVGTTEIIDATGKLKGPAGEQSNAAFEQANAAFSVANNAYSTAQTITGVDGTAQAAFVSANNSGIVALSAGAYGNSAFVQANAAFIQANTANTNAVIADGKAVTSGDYANSAFLQANSSFSQANLASISAATADSKAVTADSKAVSAGSYANSAYTQANTATTNAATADSKAVTAGSYANSAYTQANTGVTNALAASTYANAAFSQANTGVTNALAASTYANSAYGQANTATTNAATADSKAVTAGSYANSAYTQANTATTNASVADGKAVTAGSYANSAYALANTTSIRSEGSFVQANAAFSAANVGSNFVNNGGTINGSVTISQNLNITGNLVIGGNSTSISSNNLTLTDSLIYLADENAGNTSDIGIIGAYTDANGYSHLGLIRDAHDGVWKLFSNVKSEPTGTVVDLTGARYDELMVGALHADQDANVGTTLFVGSHTGTALGGATNPIIGALGNATGYIQSYIYNTANGSSSSADIVAYPNNGTDVSGWIDMGITSNNFTDTSFNVTGRNEGYVFMSAPAATGTSGNLVVATDSTGTFNSMEFYVGGFGQGKSNPAMLIEGSRVKTNKQLVFVDGTSQNTAAAPFAHTNVAFSYTNSAFTQANTAYSQAINNLLVTNFAAQNSNQAFQQANTGVYLVGGVSAQANAAFLQANGAFTQSNAAFTKANTAITTSGGTVTGALTVNGAETVTGSLRVNGQVTGNVSSIAALAIDCSAGNYFTKTISADSTFTVSNVPSGCVYSFTMELTHTAGTVTWFSGLQWPSGTAPTLTAGKVHLFMFLTDDGGTSWRGASLVNYAS